MKMMQAMELIDSAAQDNRLWHFNGGQSYIQVKDATNLLMILDHTTVDNPTVEFNDGTEYFHTYAGSQFSYSATTRQNSMVEWYKAFENRVLVDLV